MFTVDKNKVLMALAVKSMSITDLAKVTGHSKQHWHSLFVSKTRKVGPKVLGELAKGLGVHPKDLLKDTPSSGTL